jgi:hypothetical protein
MVFGHILLALGDFFYKKSPNAKKYRPKRRNVAQSGHPGLHQKFHAPKSFKPDQLKTSKSSSCRLP